MWQAVPVELRSQIKANSLEIVLKEERCDRSHLTQTLKCSLTKANDPQLARPALVLARHLGHRFD